MKRVSGSPTRLGVYTRARTGPAARRALFEDIWRHYYRGLYLFARRMAVDAAEIEDVVQEVMLKVFQRLEEYRPDFAVSTWIYTIARNHCIDTSRSKHLREKRETRSEVDHIPGRYLSPEDELQQAESVHQVELLMNSLSPGDQRIAFLRFYEEMPYRRISSVLDIPVGTLKYRVHHIRNTLRNARENKPCLDKKELLRPV